MGGGGRPPGTRARPPGAVGLRPGSLLEKSSQHYPKALSLDKGSFVICAQIYFRTNGSELRSDDRGALHRVVGEIRTLVVNGCGVDVRCQGHADVRGETDPNKALSARRLAQVEHMLESRLRHLKLCKIHPGLPHGEARSHDSPLLWAHDRRVDVLAKAETDAEREARKNPWVKTRAEIFRRYSPLYHHWAKAGLDYLVDMYEQHDQEDYPVTIKPGDLEKVYDLSLMITDPSDRGFLIQWAKSGDRSEVITDWYCVEYRKAYNEAYDRYRKSPEYGSLSPKE